MSERLGRRKMDHIEATGAEMVATGNVGCILQIARKIKERGSRSRSPTRSTCSIGPIAGPPWIEHPRCGGAEGNGRASAEQPAAENEDRGRFGGSRRGQSSGRC